LRSRIVRAQVSSMDLIIGVLVLLLLLGVILVLLSNVFDLKEPKAIYGSEIFDNVGYFQEDIRFLVDYKIDEARLDTFCALSYNPTKEQIFNNSHKYNMYTNDYCMFFLDENGPVQFCSGIDEFGHGSCSTSNPCGLTNQTYVNVRPVLKDSDDKIVNMYIIVCE